MGDLKQRLREELTIAIKTRDELTAATVRMALTAISNEEVSGTSARTLSDDEVLAVLGREAKKRREAATAFDGAGRAALAERERAELGVLGRYLPAQLTDEELTGLVATAVTEAAATGPGDMGRVMKLVQPEVAGRADGGRVAAAVRTALSGLAPG